LQLSIPESEIELYNEWVANLKWCLSFDFFLTLCRISRRSWCAFLVSPFHSRFRLGSPFNYNMVFLIRIMRFHWVPSFVSSIVFVDWSLIITNFPFWIISRQSTCPIRFCKCYVEGFETSLLFSNANSHSICTNPSDMISLLFIVAASEVEKCVFVL